MKLLITEDEYGIRQTLERFVQDIAEIEEIGFAETIEELQKQLISFQPNLILLDINIKHSNSLDFLLDFCKENENYVLPQIIITTGFDDLNFHKLAHQVHSIDYLLKPINKDELEKAIKRASQIYNGKLSKQGIHQNTIEYLQNSKKLPITTILEEYVFIEPSKITFCIADGNHTEIVLEDGNILITRIGLGDIHKKLNNQIFVRISRKYLFNMHEIKTVSKKRLTVEFNSSKIQKIKVTQETLKAIIEQMNEKYN